MNWTEDWAEATASFRSLTQAVATTERHPLGGLGPRGEALDLDVALLGPADTKRVVIVSAGLHGVEGVAGSAILRGWLKQRRALDQRLVLLHVLNPYGFAWRRRVDAANIDLNRNFLLAGQPYAGSPPGWDQVEPWLAPPRAVSRLKPWLPRLLWQVMRQGYRGVAQAVAGGQYSHPKALFFGGVGPSALQELLRTNLPRWTAGAGTVIHIDIHTGIGRPGQLQLLLPRFEGTPEAATLRERFGPEAVAARPLPRHYPTRGALGPWCQELLPEIDYTLCAAEFGTYSASKVLAALHHETRAHFWSRRDSSAARWARRQMMIAFVPKDLAWRHRVMERGLQLIDQALAS